MAGGEVKMEVPGHCAPLSLRDVEEDAVEDCDVGRDRGLAHAEVVEGEAVGLDAGDPSFSDVRGEVLAPGDGFGEADAVLGGN